MMLQTNPNNRLNCEQILNHDIVVKKMLSIKEGKESIPEQQPIQLINTIKLPRNMNEINQRLPKKKKYKELEEMNLMNNDININKKPLNPILEINNKKENERERDIKEIRDYKPKELVVENKDRQHHQMYRVPSNNNMVKNNNNYHNAANNVKKENPGIYRPSSAKNDVKVPLQQYQQPKTPVIMKDNHRPVNNINNIIHSNNNRGLNPGKDLKGNENRHIAGKNVGHIYNSHNNPVDKNKPNSQRPQSAKVGGNNVDYHNKINQVNQIVRKNIASERPKSPPRGNPVNNYKNPLMKKPSSGNSPRNKSPLKDNRINYINNQILRPSSGKDKVHVHNPALLKNDKKVVYEKINYDRGILNPAKLIDQKKQNYHYNVQGNALGNKQNLLNAVKVNDHHINRGGINNGPKIVYISNKK